mmetsp:Transcript_124422/g.387377  ORF Transcript_124422/g.387377 Transcript_124422/m.387377 type:complete len:205 (-) Transcript_124422:1216-1830(-)
MWSSGISSSASSVTSACIPIKNQRSSPVFGLRAMLSPRRSRRFRNISPDFFRLGMTAVYGTPVTLETRSRARSPGSISHPWLRNRQLTPRISLRWNPVMDMNSSDTAMSGQSGPLGSAMVTMNLQSATAALMLLTTATSFTTERISCPGPVHCRLVHCRLVAVEQLEPDMLSSSEAREGVESAWPSPQASMPTSSAEKGRMVRL